MVVRLPPWKDIEAVRLSPRKHLSFFFNFATRCNVSLSQTPCHQWHLSGEDSFISCTILALVIALVLNRLQCLQRFASHIHSVNVYFIDHSCSRDLFHLLPLASPCLGVSQPTRNHHGNNHEITWKTWIELRQLSKMESIAFQKELKDLTKSWHSLIH